MFQFLIVFFPLAVVLSLRYPYVKENGTIKPMLVCERPQLNFLYFHGALETKIERDFREVQTRRKKEEF